MTNVLRLKVCGRTGTEVWESESEIAIQTPELLGCQALKLAQGRGTGEMELGRWLSYNSAQSIREWSILATQKMDGGDVVSVFSPARLS